MVAAVAMDSDGGSFRSRVLFYQVNQKEPSLEVSLGGSSVLDMRYTDSGLWVLGESSLMIVSPKDGSVQTYSFGRSYLKGCDLSGDGFALVLLGRYRAGSADQAITVNAQGEQQAVLSLGGQVLDFSAGAAIAPCSPERALPCMTRTWSRRRPCSPPWGPEGWTWGPTAPPSWPTASGPGCISRADLTRDSVAV